METEVITKAPAKKIDSAKEPEIIDLTHKQLSRGFNIALFLLAICAGSKLLPSIKNEWITPEQLLRTYNFARLPGSKELTIEDILVFLDCNTFLTVSKDENEKIVRVRYERALSGGS